MRKTMIALTVFVAASTTVAAAEVLFKDDFKTAELDKRKPARGDWKFVDGVAKCTQDDELFKKNKDHGPIIFYDVPTTDSVIHFRYKSEGGKSFVFTLNGEGHVFRFVTNETGTNLRGFPPEGDVHSISLGADAKKPLKQGDWTDVTVTIRGPKAEVKIDGGAPMVAEDKSIARPKTNISLGYSYGTIEITDFTVSP